MNVQLQASNNVLLAQIESKGLTVETHCRSWLLWHVPGSSYSKVKWLMTRRPSHLSKKGKCWFAALKQNRCDLGNLTHPEEPFLRVGLLYPLRGETLCLSIPKLNKSHTVMLPL